MTVKEALELAIKKEEKSHNYCDLLQNLLNDEGAKAFLKEMADEELSHKFKLEQLFEINDFSTLDLSCKCAYPDLGLHRILVQKGVHRDSEVQDILAMAIQAEEESRSFYESMAKQFQGEEIEKLFIKLECEEMCHRNKLQALYDEIIYTEN